MSVHQLASYMRQTRSNPNTISRRKLSVSNVTVGNKPVRATDVNGQVTSISPNSLFSMLTTKTSNANYASRWGGANKSTAQALSLVRRFLGIDPDLKLQDSVKKRLQEKEGPHITHRNLLQDQIDAENRKLISDTRAKGKTIEEARKAQAEKKTQTTSPSGSGKKVQAPATPLTELPTQVSNQAVEETTKSSLSMPVKIGIGVGAIALIGGILYIALAD